jgi:hypothetical protein
MYTLSHETTAVKHSRDDNNAGRACKWYQPYLEQITRVNAFILHKYSFVNAASTTLTSVVHEQPHMECSARKVK